MHRHNNTADVGRAIEDTLHAAGRLPAGSIVEVDYITGVKIRVLHPDGHLDEWYDGFVAPSITDHEAVAVADFMLNRTRQHLDG
ncbi:hypothetical protein ABZ215_33525 [Amycolatopsis sp. NPDC006131]|uniref:hypothetical protein n=1 Tax=Amycolatopsis sp. NPDC006131 TaxID=3156731 RepID=UPI0033B0F933